MTGKMLSFMSGFLKDMGYMALNSVRGFRDLPHKVEILGCSSSVAGFEGNQKDSQRDGLFFGFDALKLIDSLG